MKTSYEMLRVLTDAAEEFRGTAIVDDAFPAMRDRFDTLLAEARELIKSESHCDHGYGS